MRKIKGILVCLLVFLLPSMGRADGAYQPIAFGSTSAYRSENRTSQQVMQYDSPRPVGSLAAISASNFETLNGEGGAFASSSSASGPRRAGRPWGGGTGEEIGNYEFHSPVGDTPWLLMFLLGVGYIAFRTSRAVRRRNLESWFF